MTQNSRLAVTGGSALLGPDLVETPDAVVLVENGSITAAGRDIAIPEGTETIDASGAVVLPGFIDSHVHIGLADPGDVLRGGVTTVRDLAWPLERILDIAERSRQPHFDGPLVLAAGPMLTVADGYPITAAWAPQGTGLAIESEQHARDVVAELARVEVAAIKVALNPPAGAVLSAGLLRAIVTAAHDNGLKVTAHIFGLRELEKALDAGFDELAHALMSPERIPDPIVERLVDAAVVMVPTLSIFPTNEADIAIDNVARFAAAGGRVVYGTDLGNEGPRPGIDALEVDRMERAGLTVTQIVRDATVEAASWLGLPRKGAIEPERDADLVVIEGELRSAADLTKVRTVIRSGRVCA